jgi:hypothetical protein
MDIARVKRRKILLHEHLLVHAPPPFSMTSQGAKARKVTRSLGDLTMASVIGGAVEASRGCDAFFLDDGDVALGLRGLSFYFLFFRD